jgi:D-alanine-D-alanine ligase
MGSSVGVTKVKRKGELLRAIKEAGRYDRKVLIEEGVENAREIEVSILGNDNPKASLPGEVISAREFYDYEAKYIDPRSKTVVPAKLPLGLTKKIQEIALAAFKAVDCRGMARVDFLLNRKTGKLFINEINTIPGFTLISMYPKLWQASGISYPKLLDRLISLALENARQKTKLRLSYTPSKPWHQ